MPETMTEQPAVDIARVREAVQEEYTAVAACPWRGFHFLTGRLLTQRLGYDQTAVERLPDVVVESFAGVSNPFAAGPLPPGAVVVDVGSGAGLDALLAAQKVGPTGRVIGVDMTDAMVAKARQNAALAGQRNVSFAYGFAEALPLDSATADVVISNGAINLCPDKESVYREIFRVLKPGGRLQIADVALDRSVPAEAQADIALWAG